ncbi:MAG: gliding motility-associated C-terminal domain-containing protein, partial [Bacteroidota bacterium]|nr:gliding motility-associated C-terminal domain-containing protein [Bacteroidota bacterium]MDO8998504.1 gliding motility-associated C-terminal domain-containing protein [Bacteroidota bacterium]MDP3146456.1 gliding motility-associated C-terminal domain-containing protein [Bacteroidota bacterium]MDP3146603.1 gliding motility-associated C-terminal domain-containing protein [Bacteroidota bacterium]
TMDIFDRWGEKLFSSKELANGWKGTFKNADCEQGVYIYKITYKGLDGKKVNKTGHVTLNR